MDLPSPLASETFASAFALASSTADALADILTITDVTPHHTTQRLRSPLEISYTRESAAQRLGYNSMVVEIEYRSVTDNLARKRFFFLFLFFLQSDLGGRSVCPILSPHTASNQPSLGAAFSPPPPPPTNMPGVMKKSSKHTYTQIGR